MRKAKRRLKWIDFMKIVVDIGHPAHVHVFKNFIHDVKEKNHEVLITSTDKDIALKLLNDLNLPHVNLGGTGRSLLKKVLCVPHLDYKLWKAIREFKPDIFIGLGSIRCTHIALLLGKKSVILTDTEATMGAYAQFATTIVSPQCFGRNFGKKHIRYNGYHELSYLHPNRFTPNPKVLDEIGLKQGESLFILRFISWEATHDVGHHGFTPEGKKKLLNTLKQRGRVIITAEGPLPDDLKPYQMTSNPLCIHDLLFYAKMLICESATMASEAAMLGTPVVF